ncbi:MAG: hypothetical protein UW86_C0007G0009 [Microgenomates group bacterium GW2011_GWA1_Microgenomates_45_10]|nr:MAG: hypothetical protein UW86_C0007G0009 [Microgenomates group bacterium GW2011_GWA1_Microgenomates_45_10]
MFFEDETEKRLKKMDKFYKIKSGWFVRVLRFFIKKRAD